MTQPYSKLQETFKTDSAVPKIPARRIRILPLKRRCSAASRYCTLTTSSSCRKCASTWWGDDLGDVGFDFEDLRIRKEMMGRADGIFPDGYQSIQQGFRFWISYSFMFSTALFKTFGIACLRADDEHRPLQSNRKILHKKGDAVLPVPPSFYLG